jgi:hypothetical protein
VLRTIFAKGGLNASRITDFVGCLVPNVQTKAHFGQKYWRPLWRPQMDRAEAAGISKPQKRKKNSLPTYPARKAKVGYVSLYQDH